MSFRMLSIGDGKRIVPASATTVIDGYTYSRTGKAFTGAVDEFMIYDGIALHTSNFTPPTAADYAVDYQANIKPAVYLSWVPLGKVSIKPLVLATYIAGASVPTKINGDLKREVQSEETTTVDLSRAIEKSETLTGDLLRQIDTTKTVGGDTSRQVKAEEKISADTWLKTTRAESAEADTCREVQRGEKILADTSRRIADTGVTTIYGDVARQIKATETVYGDTSRQVESEEIISADTWLSTTRAESIEAEVLLHLRHFARCDTERKTVTLQKSKADTIIRIPYSLKYYRRQTPSLLMQARGLAKANTLRAADFVDEGFVVNTFEYYGVTRVSITLSEKTLSDVFEIEFVRVSGVDVPDIGETVEFQLLDYTFTFVVEERSETQTRITIKGKYDSTYLLNTQFNLSAMINELLEEEASTEEDDDNNDDEGKDENGDYTSDDTDEDEGEETEEATEEINSTEEVALHYLSTKSSTTCSTNVAGDYLHTVISTTTVNYFYNGVGEDVYLYHEQDITNTEDKYEYMYRIYTNTVKSRVTKTETRRDTYHFPLFYRKSSKERT